MPRLKFALYLCFAVSAPAIVANGQTPPPPAPAPGPATVSGPSASDAQTIAAWLYPDIPDTQPLERETFIAMMAQHPEFAKTVQGAVQTATTQALNAGHSDPASIGLALYGLQDTASNQLFVSEFKAQVVGELHKTLTIIQLNNNVQKANPKAAPDYSKSPVTQYLLSDQKLFGEEAIGGKTPPAELYSLVNVPKYGGGSAAAPSNCPPGSGSAMGALTGAAGSGNLNTVTGDCPTGPATTVTPSATTPSVVDTSKVPTPPSTPASVTDQHTTTGPPPNPNPTTQAAGTDSNKSSGGFFSKMFGGIKSFFSSMPMNQMLAGAAFGGAIGMLLGFGSPMGVIGGAVIGGLLGAIVGSGVIGKLLGGGGTGGS